jgi:hypothetical protein
LNIHNVSDVRLYIYIYLPLVPGPSHLEVETAIAKLKEYKSAFTDQILAELIQAVGDTSVPVIYKLIT